MCICRHILKYIECRLYFTISRIFFEILVICSTIIISPNDLIFVAIVNEPWKKALSGRESGWNMWGMELYLMVERSLCISLASSVLWGMIAGCSKVSKDCRQRDVKETEKERQTEVCNKI